jgi:hypothetical protein
MFFRFCFQKDSDVAEAVLLEDGLRYWPKAISPPRSVPADVTKVIARGAYCVYAPHFGLATLTCPIWDKFNPLTHALFPSVPRKFLARIPRIQTLAPTGVPWESVIETGNGNE